MSEPRTTARLGNKVMTGTNCSSCGMSYTECTDKVLRNGRFARNKYGNPCCARCGNTDTHDARQWVSDAPTDTSGTHFYITVDLPQPLGKISELLDAVGRAWPDASIDLNHPGGWNVHIKAPE